MITGRVVRFDEGRGYGFIAPDNGGEDVFVHASELNDRGVLVNCGTRVKFNILDGERGLKAYDVQIIEDKPASAPAATNGSRPVQVAAGAEKAGGDASGDDDLCEILSETEFVYRVTDLLLLAAPELTAQQIVKLRKPLVQFARQNRWID
jgi:CspA family cold shock protein